MRYLALVLIVYGCTSSRYAPPTGEDLLDRDFIIELTNRCKDISISKKSVKLTCPDSNGAHND